jgi:AICAR transformylase/IMP cyclohydrolase PurH
VIGGVLVQSRDALVESGLDSKVVTERKPTADELAAMRFALASGQTREI